MQGGTQAGTERTLNHLRGNSHRRLGEGLCPPETGRGTVLPAFMQA